MLTIRAWWKRWWPYSAFALGVVAILAASTLAPSYEGCATNYHKHAADPDQEKPQPEAPRTFSVSAAVFVECEGEFIHENEGVITAVSTIAIALFTLALWRSTDRLWGAGEKQLALSRNIARHELRAYLGIIGAHVPDVSSLGTDIRNFVVSTIFKNYGRTPAHDVETWYSVAALPIDQSVFPEPEKLFDKWVMVPNADTNMQRRINIFVHRDKIVADPPSMGIFVWGKVRYVDIFDDEVIVEFRYRAHRKPTSDGWQLQPEPEGTKTTYITKRTTGLSEP